ncbi:MAG: LTA synthase family protein [Anaerorhabdus sp.]
MLTSSLVYVIAIVNYFKLNLRQEPLYFSDIFSVREGMTVAGQYKVEITNKMWLIFFVTIVITIILAKLPQLLELRKRERLVGMLVALALFLGPVVQGYATTAMQQYTKTPDSNAFDRMYTYSSRGVIYSFIRSYSEFVGIKPDNYSQKLVDGLMEEYTDVSLENNQINVLAIMMESYADLSKFQDFSESDVDPYYYFHQLQEDSYSGELLVDVFAGGTIQTERASMTGYSVQGNFVKNTESFAWYFARQGYTVEVHHPGLNWFYGRDKVNPRLGFETFYNEEYEVEQNEDIGYFWGYMYFMRDKDFLPAVMDRFEESIESGNPTFNFAVTLQGHGPYSSEVKTDVAYLPETDLLSDNEYNNVNNYLAEVAQTDQALQNLRERIDASDEPIVLALYGDHLPALGIGNTVGWYEKIGVNMDVTTVDGVLNMYSTPYLFYANDAAKAILSVDNETEGETISPLNMFPELFDYLNIEGSWFMNYLIDLKEELPVQNVYLYSYLGKWYQRNEELPEELSKLVDEYNAMSYYGQYKYSPK